MPLIVDTEPDIGKAEPNFEDDDELPPSTNHISIQVLLFIGFGQKESTGLYDNGCS